MVPVKRLKSMSKRGIELQWDVQISIEIKACLMMCEGLLVMRVKQACQKDMITFVSLSTFALLNESGGPAFRLCLTFLLHS